MSKKKYTKEEKREFRRKNRGISIFTSILVGMFITATAYFIYNLLKLKGVEDLLRYIFIGVLCIVCVLILVHNFKSNNKSKELFSSLYLKILLLPSYEKI